jgi:thymidine kinase
MWYGNFEMVVGCMFAGKSTEAVKRITWARDYLKRRIAVFKPAYDDPLLGEPHRHP